MDHEHSLDLIVHGEDLDEESLGLMYGIPRDLGLLRLVPSDFFFFFFFLKKKKKKNSDWSRTPRGTRPIVSLATRQVVPSTQMTASARELLPWLAERDAVLRGLMWEGRSERMRSSRAGRWLVRAGLPPDPPAPGAGRDRPRARRRAELARLDGAGNLRARVPVAPHRGDALAAAGPRLARRLL